MGAHRNIRFRGSTLKPLFKGPTIRGFWTPAPGLQNPSGTSGPARPPGFGQDPWPEPNPSSLSCQDAYRRSTCWAAHRAPNPHPMQLGVQGPQGARKGTVTKCWRSGSSQEQNRSVPFHPTRLFQESARSPSARWHPPKARCNSPFCPPPPTALTVETLLGPPRL